MESSDGHGDGGGGGGGYDGYGDTKKGLSEWLEGKRK